eukprot:831464-Prorocentrum_minimum.AAC.1
MEVPVEDSSRCVITPTQARGGVRGGSAGQPRGSRGGLEGVRWITFASASNFAFDTFEVGVGGGLAGRPRESKGGLEGV